MSGLTFNGGNTSSNGTLKITNATFTTATYNYTGVHSGNIHLDSTPLTHLHWGVVNQHLRPQRRNPSSTCPPAPRPCWKPRPPEMTKSPAAAPAAPTLHRPSFANPATNGALSVNTAGSNSLVELAANDPLFAPTTETFAGQSGDTFQFENAGAVPDDTSLTLDSATLDLNGLSPTIDGFNGNASAVVTNSGRIPQHA